MADTTPSRLKKWPKVMSIFVLTSILILWIDSYSHVRRLLIPIPLGEAPYGFLSRTGVLQFIEYDFWEHESRRDINGTVHDFMLFFLPAVIASDDYLKAPFRDTSFFMMKVRVLTENVLDHILCGTRHGVRVVISANLVNRVFRESETN